MRPRTKAGLVTTVAPVVVLILIVPFYRLSLATQSAPVTQQEKTAEQAYKNIQVFRGLPASELQNAMFYMKAALNVNCNYCHVNFTDFDKDDNPKKQVARRMIQMTRALNDTQFAGQAKISCNTCHRGQSQPDAPLALAAIREKSGSAKALELAAPPSLTVDQIFDRYITATGGPANQEKLKTRLLTGVQLSSEGATRPFRLLQQMPNKFIRILTVNSDWYDVFDGTQGWSQDNHGIRDLTGNRLAQLKRENALYQPATLKSIYTNLNVVGSDKFGNRAVYVVEGTVPGLPADRLNFDVETGLLLSITSSTKTVFGSLPAEIRLEDYRDVDGVKLPFQVSFLKPDFSSVYKFTSVKENIPIDPKNYDRPK